MFNYSRFLPIILVLCHPWGSPYYSCNYAGILGAGLIITEAKLYLNYQEADSGEKEELEGESETDSQGEKLERRGNYACMTHKLLRGRVVPDIQLRWQSTSAWINVEGTLVTLLLDPLIIYHLQTIQISSTWGYHCQLQHQWAFVTESGKDCV